MDQNIEELLRAKGIDLSKIESSTFDVHLPLEMFDDTTFDPRTPEEWLSFRVCICIYLLSPTPTPQVTHLPIYVIFFRRRIREFHAKHSQGMQPKREIGKIAR